MSEKLYKLKCRRCGRVFYDRHPNTLYCNYPSEIPSDFGRTCKQMRRVEGRAKVQEEKEALTKGLKSGNLVMTRKYGCISRQDYLQYFDNAIKEKYKLESYAQYQKWREDNVELFCEEYERFNEVSGLLQKEE